MRQTTSKSVAGARTNGRQVRAISGRQRAGRAIVNLLLTITAHHRLYTMAPLIWFEGAIDRSTWGRAEGPWGLQGVA